MKEPVAVTLRSKGSGLHLLHHHHEHNQEDGQSRPDDAYRTDDGMLAQLRQGLGNVLFNHRFVLSISFIIKSKYLDKGTRLLSMPCETTLDVLRDYSRCPARLLTFYFHGGKIFIPPDDRRRISPCVLSVWLALRCE